MSVQNWNQFYSKQPDIKKIYPTEWVVRTLAGANYPNMKLDKSAYQGARILDLSCGDGRNINLLQDLGFVVSATEISQNIIDELIKTKKEHGWDAEFKCGKNTDLPDTDSYFDYLLSCASFYYLDHYTEFSDVLLEISRVLKENGYFIGIIPDDQNFITEGASKLSDGSILIKNDPYELRNNTRFMIARDKADLIALLESHFYNFHIGHLREDYFGRVVSGFIFVCQKKTATNICNV